MEVLTIRESLKKIDKLSELTFTTKTVFENHKEVSHNETNTQTTQIKCDECSLLLKSDEVLTDHKKTHTGLEEGCQLCKEKFSTKEILEKHIRSTHDEEDDLISKKCNCEHCGLLLETTHLEKHMKTHAGFRKTCGICEINFKTKGNLDNHMKMKHGEKNESKTKQFNCDDCSFQGESGPALKKACAYNRPSTSKE